jgi:PRTRC genetic system protein B
LFFERQGNDDRLAIFVPAEQWTLATEGQGVFDVPMPPLVWVGCGRKYHVFAVKQWPGEREGLFRAPFPNVYQNGVVCEGSVAFPVASARTIRAALGLFFESLFNEDLAGGRSKKHQKNVLTLWEELDGRADFPMGDLVKSGKTLADLMGGGR